MEKFTKMIVSMRWMKIVDLAKRASLMLVGLFFGFLIAEVGLRFLDHSAVGTNLNKPSPTLEVEHAPNGFSRYVFPEHPSGYLVMATNNQGFRRDTDTQYEKPVHTYRALVLGDSHTDGAVYNQESYPNVLESMLNQEPVRPDITDYQILNAGVGSYSTYHEYLWWQTHGLLYQPDLVIVGFYVGNDMLELNPESGRVVTPPKTGNERGLTSEQPVQSPSPGPSMSLVRRVKLFLKSFKTYNIFLNLAKRPGPLLSLLVSSGIVETPSFAVPIDYAQAIAMCTACMAQSLKQAYYFARQPDKTEETFQIMAEVMTTFQQEVRNNEAELVILIIPTKLQVEPDDDAERINLLATTLHLNQDELAFDDLVRNQVLEICQRHGIEVVDLLPAFKEHYQKEGRHLYWQTDWHLNVEGNRVAAEQLYTYLTENKLLQR